MADKRPGSSGGQRQPSRLQRRAPSSIQISRVSDWNVAIPLLSPLATSPSSPPKSQDETAKEQSRTERNVHRNPMAQPEKPLVFEKWQHPAAPFCYEPAPLVPFICTGGIDRS